jgi:hypothetical protein
MTVSKSVFLYKIPKTASSSIEAGLMELHQKKLIRKAPSVGHGLPCANRMKKKNTVLISVRNPYDRLLSAYRYIIERKKDKEGLRYVWDYSFEDFVITLPKVFSRNRFFFPQTHWLLWDRKKTYTHLIRYEHLLDDWKSFVSLFTNQTVNLPHIRPSKHKPWNQVYDSKMKKVVQEVYKTDFELLDYTP